jgi:hypothetical protein
MEFEVKNEIPLSAELEKYINAEGSKLKWAVRKDIRQLEDENSRYSMVEDIVYNQGLPLVFSCVTVSWKRDREKFGFDWLRKNCGSIMISPRDNDTYNDLEEMTMSTYLDHLSKLQTQLSNPPPPSSTGDISAQAPVTRWYAKDLSCPTEWIEYIRSKIPQFWCLESRDLFSR